MAKKKITKVDQDENLSMALFIKRPQPLPLSDDENESEPVSDAELKKYQPEIIDIPSSSHLHPSSSLIMHSSKELQIPSSPGPRTAKRSLTTPGRSSADIEPHISWDVSPMVLKSSFEVEGAAVGDISVEIPPTNDPETDLLAKYKHLVTRDELVPEPERLKTPTKRSRSALVNSSVKKLSTFMNKPKLERKHRSLMRHATSPVASGSKMKRLLTLADRVSSQHERRFSPKSSKWPVSPTGSSKLPERTSTVELEGAEDFDVTMDAPSRLLPVTAISLRLKSRNQINDADLFSPTKTNNNSNNKSHLSQHLGNKEIDAKYQSNNEEDDSFSDFDEDVLDDIIKEMDSSMKQSASSVKPATPEILTDNIDTAVKPKIVHPKFPTQTKNNDSKQKREETSNEALANDTDEFSDFDDEELSAEIDKLISTSIPKQRRVNRPTEEFDGTTLIDKDPRNETNESSLEVKINDFRTERFERSRTVNNNEKISLKTNILNPRVHRYIVLEVISQEYMATAPNGREYPAEEVKLLVKNNENCELTALLRENWVDSSPSVQDIIHIIGDYQDDPQTPIYINNEINILVVLPDVLITCTSVSEAFFCQRKLVLKDRLRAATEINIQMIYGSIIHELFQFSLAANDFSVTFMNNKIDTLIEAFVEDLFICKVDPKTAKSYLESKVPKIRDWANKFISPKPKPCSFVEEHRSRSQRIMSISNVIDVEEEIWSPTYGLKGKIDVTVETCLQDAIRSWKFLSPLEIKTSKNTKAIGHRAQTTLYTLLLSDRYSIDIKYGVLVYSESGDTVRIPGFSNEVRDLMVQRNQLAKKLSDREKIPEMVENEYKCRQCDKSSACMIFHCVDNKASITAIDVKSMEKPGIMTDYISKVGHVTPSQVEFFNHWNGLLAKEEAEQSSHLKEIWTMTSRSREKAGRCFANVRIHGPPEVERLTEVESRYTYIMERFNPIQDGTFRYADSQLTAGDAIVVSDETGHVHLASGYFNGSTRTTISITINRRLTDSLQKQNGFNEQTNQAFHSLIQSPWGSYNTQNFSDSSIIFRIDKDEFRQGLSVARNNLVELLLQKHDHSNLSSIVDLKPPRYAPNLYPIEKWGVDTSHFNSDQVAAIHKVLSAKDYALILGMPGTGKTTTIATIIQILVAQGKTVLLASYTHSAVDTILRKIKNSGFGILRLGRPSLVNPDVRQFSVTRDRIPRSREQINEVYFDPPVVASTCLGITHWLFKKRKFDYCIVDEASQVTLPTCLGPIRYAEKFILVGDHFQLSPLVKSPEAQKGGLDVSLFKRLNDAHLNSVVNLEHQYRMCKDIMTVSNMLIYDGRLKCGNDQVANQVLTIPRKNTIDSWKLPACNSSTDWLSWVLNER